MACSQVPGGWAAQKYGGRVTLIASFALWSAGSLLTPRSAASTRGIMAARVLVGVAQGFIIPSIHTVLSQASALVLQISTGGPQHGIAYTLIPQNGDGVCSIMAHAEGIKQGSSILTKHIKLSQAGNHGT